MIDWPIREKYYIGTNVMPCGGVYRIAKTGIGDKLQYTAFFNGEILKSRITKSDEAKSVCNLHYLENKE